MIFDFGENNSTYKENDELCYVKDNNINNSLWLYCSFDSFYKMIQNHILRFGNIFNSDDEFEKEHFYKVLKEFYGNGVEFNKIKKKIDYYISNYYFFASYLSCDPFNKRMWEKFARNGVVVGFDGIKLVRLIKDKLPKLRHGKCVYLEGKESLFSAMTEVNTTNESDSIKNFVDVAVLAKHQFFNFEREYRLIYKVAKNTFEDFVEKNDYLLINNNLCNDFFLILPCLKHCINQVFIYPFASNSTKQSVIKLCRRIGIEPKVLNFNFDLD